jgi:hypothetical protein
LCASRKTSLAIATRQTVQLPEKATSCVAITGAMGQFQTGNTLLKQRYECISQTCWAARNGIVRKNNAY